MRCVVRMSDDSHGINAYGVSAVRYGDEAACFLTSLSALDKPLRKLKQASLFPIYSEWSPNALGAIGISYASAGVYIARAQKAIGGATVSA
jgi:hypothetical protein